MSDLTIFRLLKLMIYLLGRLPVPLADFCADAMGLLWFKLDTRHRNVTLDNLTHAYGENWTEARRTRVAKQVFKNLVRILFEVAWSCKFDKETFLSHFTVKGIEHVKAAHAKGKGVLVATCHMGNFEMLIPAIDETGYKGYAIYRTMDFLPLEWLLRMIRQRFGVTMVPMRGASRKIETYLSRGGVIGTLFDQNVDWYKGVFVEYFGRPACTNNGLAKLALKTGAPVLPMYTVRRNRQFFIEFLPEVPLRETGDRIKDIEANTQAYTAAVESMVRRHPEQYFWVHNRWKTKPFCPWPRP